VRFRWNAWNVDHIARHGVMAREADAVVRAAKQPYPLWRSDDKWLVWGRTQGGRMLQVVFVLDALDAIYVIHARDLTPREKSRYRARRKP
jgi:uncharacterized DUF497 family protein